jgi:hypothetical protein
MAFHALTSLSIGAVLIDPAHFHQYQEVARAASEAKHIAKRIDGSNLFIDQRRIPFGRQLVNEARAIGQDVPAKESATEERNCQPLAQAATLAPAI